MTGASLRAVRPDNDNDESQSLTSIEPAEAVATAAEPPPAPQPSAPPVPTQKPAWLAGSYMLAAVILALAQGLGMNFISGNILQIQGSLGATTVEATWLLAAYMAPNASLSLALIKIRTQYGLRNFAELSILVFVGVSLMHLAVNDYDGHRRLLYYDPPHARHVAVSLLHLVVNDYQSTLMLRFFAGVAAAPMSSLAFLYMLEPFLPARKMTIGLCCALANLSIAAPLARLVSPPLLDIGGWHALYALEIAFALMAFCAVYLLPLTPQPRAKVISFADIVSYLFIAVGFGCLAVTLVMGKLLWWTEAPLLGLLLVVAIAALVAAAIIELNRSAPLIDIRWLTSKEVLHFMGVLLIFRIALSETTTGAYGLFQVIGLAPEQTRIMWTVVLVTSIAAGLFCALLMKPGREPFIHGAALLLIGIGAWMDSNSTALTRPEQVLISQTLITAGGALFLPPALASGLMSALKKGPNYILSFVIVFLTTQSLGGLFGSALLGSFITLREKFHLGHLTEHLVLTDPNVALRVSQLGGAYAKVLTDTSLISGKGIQLLGQQVSREASILAYNDLFLIVAALCAASLVALLLHSLIKSLRPAPTGQPA